MRLLLKNIAMVISAVATIAGAALWLDSKFDGMADSDKEVMESVEDVKEMVEYINVEQGFMALEQQAIHDSLEMLAEKQEGLGGDMSRLVWMVRNQDSFTPDQLELILDTWSKKNEQPIVSASPELDTLNYIVNVR